MLKLILGVLLFVGVLTLSEPYAHTDRPDIKKVNSLKMTNPPTAWGKVKDGSVAFIAELQALYPDAHYYFLARDAEYTYDISRELNSGSKKVADRFHLLHISRKMMNDPHLKDYLKQEGVSSSNLGKNAPVVFIDTGWRGTIPTQLVNMVSNLKGISQMIHSDDGSISSSRVFIESLNKNVSPNTTDHHQEIVDYVEHLPHFSERAVRFLNKNGTIIPVTDTLSNDRANALSLMGDIKEYASNPKTLKRYERLQEDMNDLMSLARNEISLSDQDVADILRRLETNKASQFLEDVRESEGHGNLPFTIKNSFWSLINKANQLEGSAARRNRKVDEADNPPLTLSDVSKKSINIGDRIQLTENEVAIVIEVTKDSEGERRIILSNDNSDKFEIITSSDSSQKSSSKFSKTVDRIDKLNLLKISQPPVLKSTKSYIVRSIPSGFDVDKWVKKKDWKSGEGALAYRSLVDLVKSLSEKGIYLGNIRPADFIWDSNNQEWLIKNVGHIKENTLPSDTLNKYIERFGDRWSKILSKEISKSLINCNAELAKLGK